MEAYVDAYKMKAYEIAQDHYQELAKQFSEKEMDTCPTMEWVIAFAQFKYHNDTAFCRDIVDYMKKNCNDDQKDRKNSGVVVV
jgi:cytochrome c1